MFVPILALKTKSLHNAQFLRFDSNSAFHDAIRLHADPMLADLVDKACFTDSVTGVTGLNLELLDLIMTNAKVPLLSEIMEFDILPNVQALHARRNKPSTPLHTVCTTIECCMLLSQLPRPPPRRTGGRTPRGATRAA